MTLRLNIALRPFAILLFGVFSLMSINGVSQSDECLPEPPSASTPVNAAYVHDFSNSFSAGERARLSKRLKQFRDSTSNEIVIICPDTLCGMDVWDYGVKIGDLWGVGQAELDNGLVIVYVPKKANKKGKIAIATGRGLEGALPDGSARMIIEREMIPSFKQGKITSGLTQGMTVMEDILTSEYSYGSYLQTNKKTDYTIYIPLAIFLLFIIFWLIQVGMYARTNKISYWQAMVLMSKTKGTHSGRWRGFRGGTGGFGGYRGGSSGGGGFGGFGGGSFGGGGASGSW
ncbi:MAG: YgcG family protein [Flavobacteriales bacterium]